MKVYIKNMVCNRCKMAVMSILERLNLPTANIELGEVTFLKSLTNEERSELKAALYDLGFELISDRKSRMIEQIKILIIDLVHRQNSDLKINLSNYLSGKLHQDYSYLAMLFSEIESVTIEKYFIAQKIEKVKELLVYDELTLSEIADQLHYSSVAHLSGQFKKVTGFTPSHFKNIRAVKRKPLDEI